MTNAALRTLVLRVLISLPFLNMATAARADNAPSPGASGAIEVRVVDGSGAAVTDAEVLLQRAPQPAFGVPGNDTGVYRSEGLVSGVYVLTIVKVGFAPVSREITIEPGRLLAVSFTLAPRGLSEHVTVEGASPFAPPSVVSGTRLPSNPLDVPQTIDVVSQTLIRSQAALSMQDALLNVPGVTPQLGEGRRDQTAIRGFSALNDTYLDGVRDDAKYYRDLATVDQVEVVKGPSGALFGRGSSGGVINRVTKKPAFGSRFGDVSLIAGSYDRVRMQGDYADGRSSDRFAYRVAGAYENTGSNRPYYSLERGTIAPSFAYRPRPGAELTVQAEFLSDDRLPDRGIPSWQGVPLAEARPFYYGYPSDDFLKNRVASQAVTWQQALAHGWTVRNVFRHTYYDNDFSNTLPGAVRDVDGQLFVARSQYNVTGNQRNLFNQTDLSTGLSTGAVDHTLLVGVELGREATAATRFTGTASEVAALDPALTAPIYATTPATDNEFTGTYAGLYVQDQITFGGRWRALVGGRYDYNDQQLDDRLPVNRDLGRVDQAFSPRAGVVYRVYQATSLYSSVSRSFQPSGDGLSLAVNNEELEPERSTNYEAGVKTELFGRRLTVTTALFRLDRTNVKTRDPLDSTKLVLVGRQRSQGVEVSAGGSLRPGWDVSGGFTWLDPTILRSNDVTSGVIVEGNRIGNVAARSGSLWTTYTLKQGITFGGGVFVMGDRFTSNDNLVVLDGYARVDAMASYRFGRYDLQVNVRNLLDQDYYESAQGNNNIMPAAGVNGLVSLRYRF
jgi:catecholate siderophore receptor